MRQGHQKYAKTKLPQFENVQVRQVLAPNVYLETSESFKILRTLLFLFLSHKKSLQPVEQLNIKDEKLRKLVFIVFHLKSKPTNVKSYIDIMSHSV